jgi:hypothetical protein
MTEQNFNPEGDFTVKESKTINYVAGGVMILIFAIAMIFGDLGMSNFIFALGIFLIPGAIAIGRGISNSTIIRINKTGFYYSGKLITDWNLFHDAEVQDKLQVGSYKDNFILDLSYYSIDYTIIYTKNIPLTNTQDKAEEEIIEAIQFYCNIGRMIQDEAKSETA